MFYIYSYPQKMSLFMATVIVCYRPSHPCRKSSKIPRKLGLKSRAKLNLWNILLIDPAAAGHS